MDVATMERENSAKLGYDLSLRSLQRDRLRPSVVAVEFLAQIVHCVPKVHPLGHLQATGSSRYMREHEVNEVNEVNGANGGQSYSVTTQVRVETGCR